MTGACIRKAPIKKTETRSPELNIANMVYGNLRSTLFLYHISQNNRPSLDRTHLCQDTSALVTMMQPLLYSGPVTGSIIRNLL